MASSSLLGTIHTLSRDLLCSDAAKNISFALAHAQRTLESFFPKQHTPPIPVEADSWQETVYEQISDFISSRSSLENTSFLLAICTFLFLLVRNMSWTSRLGNLGRFSPFTRSPNQGGPTKVSDSDFSYITADDLRRHQAESISNQPQTESPVEYGPPRDTDVLILKNKRKEYAVHFPAYSIAKGELTVGQVREAAAKKTHSPDVKVIKLFYKGKNLKDDARTGKQEGLRDGSEILCSIAEQPPSVSGSDSEDEEEGIDAGREGAAGEGSRRKRNRGKRSRRRNRREADRGSGASTPERQPANLDVPLSQTSTRTASRAPSPKPLATPATPLDKLNNLQATLNSFRTDVDNFLKHPPADTGKKEFEHKRLSETILTQVLLKLDAVETEGDTDARARRKDLVRETQAVLTELDSSVKK